MKDEQQDQLKKIIIENLQKTPVVQVVCEKVGVSRATYYRWRKEDDQFEKDSDEAVRFGEGRVNDMAESQLLTLIRDKNVTAIIFWLKHHHQQYATRVEVTAQLKQVPEKLTPEQERLVNKALKLAALSVPEDIQEGEIEEP